MFKFSNENILLNVRICNAKELKENKDSIDKNSYYSLGRHNIIHI